MRMRRLLLLIALVSAAPAWARPPVVPDPPVAATAVRRVRPPAPMTPLRSPESDPSLASPSLARQSVLSTPRYDRSLEDGAAACRNSCAPGLYDCLSDRDRAQCQPRWAQCVSACQNGAVSR